MYKQEQTSIQERPEIKATTERIASRLYLSFLRRIGKSGSFSL
jgi:hypothetical protein